MITLRRRATIFFRALGAALVICALTEPIVAQESSDRSYPPKYSKRNTPWYDVSSWFTSNSKEDKPEPKKVPVPIEKSDPSTSPLPKALPKPSPAITDTSFVPSTPMVPLDSGLAWKWYGYGAPTPGNNPLAPAGKYEHVVPTWHQALGSTPGAVPLAQLRLAGQPLIEQPRPPVVSAVPSSPIIAPPIVAPPPLNNRKEILPEGDNTDPLVKAPKIVEESPAMLDTPALIAPIPPIAKSDSVEWKPAKLASPVPEAPRTPPAFPRVTLKPPVPVDVQATNAPAVPKDPVVQTPTGSVRPTPPPGAALPIGNTGTPDIPIDPALGIRAP